jgi:hypothetical protein
MHVLYITLKFILKEECRILCDASKEVRLEVDTEKTKYMLLSHHQNAGQNHDIRIANTCFENVAQLKIFENDYNKSKPDLIGN